VTVHSIRAEPYPYTLPVLGESGNIALIMIDMQRDFIEPGGFGSMLGNDVTPLREIVPACQCLLAAFRELRLPVIHTQEGHRPDLADCPAAKKRRGNLSIGIGDRGPLGRVLVQGELGNDIIPELAPRENEIRLSKPGKGAFCSTVLNELLKEHHATHLVFAGVTTEVCVQTTMREANDRGYECILAEDATASYFPQFKAATLAMIKAQGGIVGWVASVATISNALRAAYAHP
jgi:biuret amidohydrolase